MKNEMNTDIDSKQARLAEIAGQEKALREERKSLEHDLAPLKAARPYSGPVTGAEGELIEANIEGVTATAVVAGNSIDD